MKKHQDLLWQSNELYLNVLKISSKFREDEMIMWWNLMSKGVYNAFFDVLMKLSFHLSGICWKFLGRSNTVHYFLSWCFFICNKLSTMKKSRWNYLNLLSVSLKIQFCTVHHLKKNNRLSVPLKVSLCTLDPLKKNSRPNPTLTPNPLKKKSRTTRVQKVSTLQKVSTFFFRVIRGYEGFEGRKKYL